MSGSSNEVESEEVPFSTKLKTELGFELHSGFATEVFEKWRILQSYRHIRLSRFGFGSVIIPVPGHVVFAKVIGDDPFISILHIEGDAVGALHVMIDEENNWKSVPVEATWTMPQALQYVDFFSRNRLLGWARPGKMFVIHPDSPGVARSTPVCITVEGVPARALMQPSWCSDEGRDMVILIAWDCLARTIEARRVNMKESGRVAWPELPLVAYMRHRGDRCFYGLASPCLIVYGLDAVTETVDRQCVRVLFSLRFSWIAACLRRKLQTV